MKQKYKNPGIPEYRASVDDGTLRDLSTA